MEGAARGAICLLWWGKCGAFKAWSNPVNTYCSHVRVLTWVMSLLSHLCPQFPHTLLSRKKPCTVPRLALPAMAPWQGSGACARACARARSYWGKAVPIRAMRKWHSRSALAKIDIRGSKLSDGDASCRTCFWLRGRHACTCCWVGVSKKPVRIPPPYLPYPLLNAGLA